MKYSEIAISLTEIQTKRKDDEFSLYSILVVIIIPLTKTCFPLKYNSFC